MWRPSWWLHKATGFREYHPPRKFTSLRWWALWAWNEYDDYLFNGIHGFRVLGMEFDTYPGWLNWLCWRLLPILRWLNPRAERTN